jgi:transposase
LTIRSNKKASHLAATIVRLIRDRCPDQLKLPFALWTRDAVRQLIKIRFGISVSVWTVGRYLKRWGFTPQKPLRRAYERNPEAVKLWLEKDYPAIRQQAHAERAQIHWGDEMGMRSDHQTGRNYGLKGQTPVVPGTGKRFGCNMISAITNRGRLAFMVFKERFTGLVMIEFLRRLIKQNCRKVFLIVDGHPVHGSRQVKRWVYGHSKKIRLFYLPGYSPELNPDEYLNQDVKTNAVGRQRPKDQPEIMEQVRSYLRSTQCQPQIVRNYFQHEDVRYAAK